jgi:hypothetical protein
LNAADAGDDADNNTNEKQQHKRTQDQRNLQQVLRREVIQPGMGQCQDQSHLRLNTYMISFVRPSLTLRRRSFVNWLHGHDLVSRKRDRKGRVRIRVKERAVRGDCELKSIGHYMRLAVRGDDSKWQKRPACFHLSEQFNLLN